MTAPAPSTPPDPSASHIDFQVENAGAQQAATLYAAATTEVDAKYAKLAGAQSVYDAARTAAATTYDDVTRRFGKLAKRMETFLEKAYRDQLDACWKTISAAGAVDCTAIASMSKADTEYPKRSIGDLTADVTTATNCAQLAADEVDRLTGLPADLASRITALSGRIDALERDVACPGHEDARERSYAEFLQLNDDIGQLKADWMTTVSYGVALAHAFISYVDLTERRIWLTLAVTRWNSRTNLRAAAAKAAGDSIVDRVLQCAKTAVAAAPPTASVAAGIPPKG